MVQPFTSGMSGNSETVRLLHVKTHLVLIICYVLMNVRNRKLKVKVRLRLMLARELIIPLNTELNPICHLLALLGARHILHVSRVRFKVANKSYSIYFQFSIHPTSCQRRYLF